MTDGPDLAERQLREFAAVSGGSVEVLATQDTAAGRWLTISMDTSGLPAGAGIGVRDRGRFHILVGADYPHRHPSAWVPHRRWAGARMCSGAGPAPVRGAVGGVGPSGGMDSFIERLAAWVVRAAEGTLDPDGQPLHPPVAYPTAGPAWRWSIPMSAIGPRGLLVPVSWGSLRSPRWWRGARSPVTALTSWSGSVGSPRTTGCSRTGSALHGGRPLMVMPVLLISGELGFEYPDRAWDLVAALGEGGFSLDGILMVLADAIIINRVLRISQVQAPDAAGRRPAPIRAARTPAPRC